MTPERLVILQPGPPAAAGPVRAAILQVVSILHSGSDRVFVVTGDETALRRVPRIPGVLIVLSGDETDDQMPVLDPSDELFARAWLLGRRAKQRKGEGLSWDAPGFLPPDRK